MKKLLVVIIIPIFAAGGLFAGFMMRPPSDDVEDIASLQDDGANEPASILPASDLSASGEQALSMPAPEVSVDGPPAVDYVKLEKQFVVPLVDRDRVDGLMIITMALETDQGVSDLVFAHEPKLRDKFLQVLFTHAQSGGFSGSFTDLNAMEDLRLALNTTAQTILGKSVRSVLLTNMIRQDL